MSAISEQKKIVFETAWFKVLATAGESPHYLLQSPDFVVVVALDSKTAAACPVGKVASSTDLKA